MRRYPSQPASPVLAVFLFAVACDDPVEPPVDPAAATVEKVAEKPSIYEGQTVSLVGDVDRVFGPQAFELEENLDFLFEDELLVLTKSPVRFGGNALQKDDEVVVRGTVRTFVTAEIEREVGWDLGRHLEVDELERHPVVIATSIHQINEYGRWTDLEPTGTRVGWSSTMLEREPAELEDEPITLESVQVLSTSGRGLWVGSRLFPVLAVLDDDLPSFEAKRWVDLRGTIERLPPRTVAAKSWDLSTSFLERLGNDAYYIAVERIEEAKDLPSVIAEPVAYEKFAANMGQHLDQLVSGQSKVTKVISDRGFYLENPQGDDIFAVVREDVPFKEMIDIDAGDQLRFEAWSRAPTDPVRGKLEDDAVSAIGDSEGFLTMYWRNVEIVDPSEKGSASEKGT